MSRRHHALSLLLLAGCAPPDAPPLEGSLTDSYDLTFEVTRARLYDSELSIEYLSLAPEVVVLRVTVLNGGDLSGGRAYDLLDRGHIGRSDSFDAELPELTGGELRLDALHSDHTAGDFDALFTTVEGNVLTLRGVFDAPVEEIDL